MPATFTIEGELSEQGLLQAKAAIDDLLGEAAASSTETDGLSGYEELALRKVKLLRRLAGDATWHFMGTIARHYQPEQSFTFDDLSETFGEDKETVKSWHRSASKIMNKVNAELGVEPQFLEATWDGLRQHYRMPDVIHDAIIAAGA